VVNCVLLRDRYQGITAEDVRLFAPQDGGQLLKEKMDGNLRREHNPELRHLVRFCSTHFPSDESLAQLSAPVLFTEVSSLKEAKWASGRTTRAATGTNRENQEMTIIVGDFNSMPSSRTYDILSQEGWFVDARLLATKEPIIAATSITAETTPANISTTVWYQIDEMLIDYIFLLRPPAKDPNEYNYPVKIDTLTHLPVLTSVPAPLGLVFQRKQTLQKSHSWHEIASKSLSTRFASDHMMIVSDLHWEVKK